MKYILVALLTVLSASAFAVDGSVFFNGTVASSCSFSSASAGTVNISGTAITAGTSGTINVLNNDPGTFTLSLGATTLSTAPSGETLTSSTATPTVTGANAALVLPGLLANAGTDTVSISLTGTLGQTATAGAYVFTQVVSCV